MEKKLKKYSQNILDDSGNLLTHKNNNIFSNNSRLHIHK